MLRTTHGVKHSLLGCATSKRTPRPLALSLYKDSAKCDSYCRFPKYKLRAIKVMPQTVDCNHFFEVSGNRYVAWPSKEISCDQDIEHKSLVTIIDNSASHDVTSAWLEDVLENSLKEDGVIKPEFFANVLLTGTSSFEPRHLPTKWGGSSVQALHHENAMQCALGPHIVYNKALWQVLKLYDDVQRTFLVTLKPLSDGSFTRLNDGAHDWECASAAVKSRFAFRDFDLDGPREYRVAIKDAFDISGTRISMCNKAYLSLYPPATSHAESITDLIKAGIQVLGKTKLSSFLSREEPSESVDYQTVWNPRGDGYQGPDGSSSGSAAAVAAYDWTDIGIGTDS